MTVDLPGIVIVCVNRTDDIDRQCYLLFGHSSVTEWPGRDILQEEVPYSLYNDLFIYWGWRLYIPRPIFSYWLLWALEDRWKAAHWYSPLLGGQEEYSMLFIDDIEWWWYNDGIFNLIRWPRCAYYDWWRYYYCGRHYLLLKEENPVIIPKWPWPHCVLMVYYIRWPTTIIIIQWYLLLVMMTMTPGEWMTDYWYY